ncbi:hypothetical protein BDZ45DRAFT_375432 [Acephala macrosclerotiorum]|nr:hypothetical protein BDZ45DRAFT_375432 [Acephala macrosclerotiorum]
MEVEHKWNYSALRHNTHSQHSHTVPSKARRCNSAVESQRVIMQSHAVVVEPANRQPLAPTVFPKVLPNSKDQNRGVLAPELSFRLLMGAVVAISQSLVIVAPDRTFGCLTFPRFELNVAHCANQWYQSFMRFTILSDFLADDRHLPCGFRGYCGCECL